MRRTALLLAAACLALPALAQRADVKTLDYRLQARALAPGVWVVEGDNADFTPANGCNIINTGFIATGAGVLVVNTGPSRTYGEQLRALIRRTTAEPVVQVLHLNLHPDYFLGNQAFADVPRLATDSTRAGMVREAKAYEDNLYRLCGDWMKGTEAVLPSGTVMLGPLRVGGRDLLGTEYNGRRTTVSARRLPPLFQVQQCSGRGLVQPIDQLIDNGVQAKPMQQFVERPLEQARRDQLALAMRVDMRQVEREVRTQEWLGRGQGPFSAEHQNACFDRAYSGLGYPSAPRPAWQFNGNIDFNLRQRAQCRWLANADKAPMPLKLM